MFLLHPIYTNLALKSLLFIQHHHLAFTSTDFYTPQQNIPPLLFGLPLTCHTKPSHLHRRGQEISTLSLPEFLLLFFQSIFSSQYPCVYIYIYIYIFFLESQRDMIHPCLMPLSILKHSLTPFYSDIH